MSARDWSTIGAGASLPRWFRWATPPLLVPLAAMAWMAINWNRIPLRYAISFGSNGRVTAWTTRTPLHVFGFPVFAEGLAALLVGLALGIWYGSRRPSSGSFMEKAPLAMAYLMSLIFTATGLVPVMQLPIWLLVVIIPPLVLGTIVYVIYAQAKADNTAVETPAECWTLGLFYRNPKDPSLFVPAKMGNGYSFNMANPWSGRLLAGLFLGIGLLIAFLVLSLQ